MAGIQPIDFNDSTPAAPSGTANVKWQAQTPGTDPTVPRETSAYMPAATATLPGAVPTPPNDATKFLNGTMAYSVPSIPAQPYAIPFDIGDGLSPLASQSLLKHIVSGDLTNVAFVAGLATSKFKARTTSTGTYVITIKIAGTSVGTITFSAGVATAVLAMASNQNAAALAEIELVGQSSVDATLAGIYGTLSGTRT